VDRFPVGVANQELKIGVFDPVGETFADSCEKAVLENVPA